MSGANKPSGPLLDDDFLKTVERLTLAVGHPFSGRARPVRRSPRRKTEERVSEPAEDLVPDARAEVPSADIPFASPAASAQDLEVAALCHLFRETLTAAPNLRLNVLLDAGQSMALPAGPGETAKFHYARRLAGALGYAALIRYQQVQVSAFAPRIGGRTPTLRGREAGPTLLRYLEKLRPGGDHFARVLEHFATRNSQSSICVVVSDFLDPQWEKGIRALLSRRFRVILLQVLTPSDVEPTLGNALRLVDAGTGQARDVNLGPAATARYQDALDSFFGMLGDAAGKHGMEYLRITTSTPFEEALLSTLRAAGLPRRP